MHRLARLCAQSLEQRPAGAQGLSTAVAAPGPAVSGQNVSPLLLTVPRIEAFAPASGSMGSTGLLALAKRHPLAAAVFCGCLKDTSCDLATQKATSDIWDWRRTAVMATFGATFVGAWQYWLFSYTLPRLVPQSASFAAAPLRQKLRDSAGLAGIAAFVAVKNVFAHPFAYFPSLYAIKHGLEGGEASPECIRSGLEEYRENFWRDNANSCAVWVPATVVNGLFVPVALRVPFLLLIGSGWTSFVSLTKLSPPGAEPDAVEEAYAARRIPRAPEVARRAVDGLFASPWARNPFMGLVGCGFAAFSAHHLTLPAAEAKRSSPPLSPEVLAAVEAADEDGDTVRVQPHREPEPRPSLLSLFDEEEDDDLKKSA